jgi:uncharacterized protein with NRDE domain
MCIIFACVGTVPGLKLLLLVNRDEFLARPTLPTHWWEGGRVLGGTLLALALCPFSQY